MFADDCVVFCRSQIGEWRRIEGILKIYECASGHTINKHKTAIFFSNNTKKSMRNLIIRAMGATGCNNYEKYLRLLVVVGRSKYNTFQSIKERVRHKIQNCKKIYLSKAGKEIMIKAVLQAIPTYSMSVFRIPKKLCKELEALMAKYWWRQGKRGTGIHW